MESCDGLLALTFLMLGEESLVSLKTVIVVLCTSESKEHVDNLPLFSKCSPKEENALKERKSFIDHSFVDVLRVGAPLDDGGEWGCSTTPLEGPPPFNVWGMYCAVGSVPDPSSVVPDFGLNPRKSHKVLRSVAQHRVATHTRSRGNVDRDTSCERIGCDVVGSSSFDRLVMSGYESTHQDRPRRGRLERAQSVQRYHSC